MTTTPIEQERPPLDPDLCKELVEAGDNVGLRRELEGRHPADVDRLLEQVISKL